MDDNTRAVIESNARHAATEVEGILDKPDDAAHIRECLRAAGSRLAYIDEVLTEAGHPPTP